MFEMDDQLRTTIMDYFEQFTCIPLEQQEKQAEGLVDYLAERGYDIKTW